MKINGTPAKILLITCVIGYCHVFGKKAQEPGKVKKPGESNWMEIRQFPKRENTTKDDQNRLLFDVTSFCKNNLRSSGSNRSSVLSWFFNFLRNLISEVMKFPSRTFDTYVSGIKTHLRIWDVQIKHLPQCIVEDTNIKWVSFGQDILLNTSIFCKQVEFFTLYQAKILGQDDAIIRDVSGSVSFLFDNLHVNAQTRYHLCMFMNLLLSTEDFMIDPHVGDFRPEILGFFPLPELTQTLNMYIKDIMLWAINEAGEQIADKNKRAIVSWINDYIYGKK